LNKYWFGGLTIIYMIMHMPEIIMKQRLKNYGGPKLIELLDYVAYNSIYYYNL